MTGQTRLGLNNIGGGPALYHLPVRACWAPDLAELLGGDVVVGGRVAGETGVLVNVIVAPFAGVVADPAFVIVVVDR